MIFMLAPIFLSALLDWYAVYKGWRKLEYTLKPLTMVLLFIFLFVNTGGLSGIALCLASALFSLWQATSS